MKTNKGCHVFWCATSNPLFIERSVRSPYRNVESHLRTASLITKYFPFNSLRCEIGHLVIRMERPRRIINWSGVIYESRKLDRTIANDKNKIVGVQHRYKNYGLYFSSPCIIDVSGSLYKVYIFVILL